MARILVIDDEDLVRASMRVTLEGAGHEVTEARDGEEGIERQTEKPFDLVFTNIHMPTKEGLETIMQLVKAYQDLKIVATSGGGQYEPINYLKVAKELGACGSLAKPFSNAELLQCVEEYL